MKQALSATVTGDDQGVGFRALIMKQAIRNLAGSAENEPNAIVRFSLQGDSDRIDEAIARIREGTPRSADIDVRTTEVSIDPNLQSFTVMGWTSHTRQIANPYNLRFDLRPDDSEISKDEAKGVWHQILRDTLKGDDLAKLQPED